MPTNQAIWQNHAEQTVHFDFDTVAAGAVSTATGGVRGDGIVVTKTGAGVYTVRVANVNFYEVTHREVQLHQATPTAFWAAITAVDAAPTAGTGALITITTLQANAAPVATNLGANATISGSVTFRRWKVVSP